MESESLPVFGNAQIQEKPVIKFHTSDFYHVQMKYVN